MWWDTCEMAARAACDDWSFSCSESLRKLVVTLKVQHCGNNGIRSRPKQFNLILNPRNGEYNNYFLTCTVCIFKYHVQLMTRATIKSWTALIWQYGFPMFVWIGDASCGRAMVRFLCFLAGDQAQVNRVLMPYPLSQSAIPCQSQM